MEEWREDAGSSGRKTKPRRRESAEAEGGPEDHSLNHKGSALRAEGTVTELGECHVGVLQMWGSAVGDPLNAGNPEKN